jgi:Protein phosphatase 2C
MLCVVLACGLLVCLSMLIELNVLAIISPYRAIGDVSLQPYVTCHPEILEKEIGPEDEYLVLASDGLWVRNSSLLSSLPPSLITSFICYLISSFVSVI